MAEFQRNVVHFKQVKSGWLTQKYRFQIVAGNGEILCWSESYHNARDCDRAMESVRRYAGAAPVIRAWPETGGI